MKSRYDRELAVGMVELGSARHTVIVRNRVRYRLRGKQWTTRYRNLVHCRLLMLAKVLWSYVTAFL